MIGPGTGVKGDLACGATDIHRHGRLKGPTELVVNVTGAPPSIAPLLAYLEEKYATLYDL